jgi:hypothetical protein
MASPASPALGSTGQCCVTTYLTAAMYRTDPSKMAERLAQARRIARTPEALSAIASSS